MSTTKYKLPKGKALMLRTCAADMTSYGGFQWKESGTVIARDFDPNPVYGKGLRGLLWGQGDAGFLNWAVDAKWLVCEIDAESLIDLGGKIEVKRAKVVYCGERQAALDFIRPHLPAAMPLPGDVVVSGYRGTSTSGYRGTSTSGYRGTSTSGHRGTSTSGDWGTSTSGDLGTSTSGDWGTSTSGYRGTSTSGYRGTSTSGYRGTSTSGHRGTSTSGDWGTSTSGYRGTSTSGYGGTSTSGDLGTSQSGDRGTLIIRWFDGGRYRTAVAYVGENGIKPYTPYRLDTKGNFVEVQP